MALVLTVYINCTENWILIRIGVAVTIGTMPRAGRPGFNSGQGQCWDFLSSPRCVHPATYIMGTRLKRTGRQVDHSPPSTTELKHTWNYTSTLQYAFMAWCLVKYRNNFTFTFVRTWRSGKNTQYEYEIRWAGHVARMGNKNCIQDFRGKSREKRPLESKETGETNRKMYQRNC